MIFLRTKTLVLALATTIIAVGGFSNTVHAQTPPATTPAAPGQYLVQPATDYKNKDVSALGTCFGISGSFNGTCGNTITSANAQTSYRGLNLVAGDTLHCSPTSGSVYDTCTTLHTDGSADSSLPDAIGNNLKSHTDASGNTTVTATDTVGNQLASSPVGAAVGAAVAAGECALTGPVNCLITAVGSAVLGISTLLLGIAGVVFNLVIVKTVFGFATLIGNAPGLLVAWGILRDLGNMLILFGFIFIGLATVLGLQTYSAKKALPRLIIFAILMNFSLFAAEAIIDLTNGLSSAMYAQANSAPCVNLTGTQQAAAQSSSNQLQAYTSDCSLNTGLGGSIMSASGLSTMFDPKITQDGGKLQSISVYVGLSLFAIIGAVVLFAGSILLAIRAITLTFLMVLAPIGFAGMAVPVFQSGAKKWWNALLKQAFFAPVFILLTLVSLKVTSSFSGGGGVSLAGALTQPNSSVMGIILVFSLVIGFLVGSLIVAKNMGAMGASFAVKTAGGVTGGTFGYLGRNTVGRGFNSANDKIRKSAFGQTRIGRRVALITEKGSKASYDPRGTKAVGALGKRIGDLGKPPKDGYAGQLKLKSEDYTKYAGTLKQTEAAKAKEERLNKKKKTIDASKKIEDSRWNNDRKTREGAMQNLRDQVSARDKARAEQSARVTAAISSGNVEAERREQARLDEMTRENQALNEQAKADLSTMQQEFDAAQNEHNNFMDGFDREIKSVDVQIKGGADENGNEIIGVDGNSSKRQFAANLTDGSRRENIAFFGGTAARKKASDAIKADLKKSKAEKLVEGLKKSIDSGSHDQKEKLDAVKNAVDEETKATKEAGGHGADDHGGGGDHGH